MNEEKVRLYQKAIVNVNPSGAPSIKEGEVTLISRRGINVSGSYGDRFVKWANVMEIFEF